MKLVGIMPVRNEDWVLGLSARAALMWCDELVVFLHACTDRSRMIAGDIEQESKGQLFMMHNDDPTWSEMSHRWAMLTVARARGATHIAIVDADEVLTGNLLNWPGIRQIISGLPENVVYQLPWLGLARSTDQYLTSGTFGLGQRVSMAFKDFPGAHWKSQGPEGYDFHHREPFGISGGAGRLQHAQGGLMHLQFLSVRRLRAKQALYQITEVLRWPGRETPEQLAKKYGRAVYESDPAHFATAPVPAEWWAPYQHLMKHLDIGVFSARHRRYIYAEPWQEREVRRLVKEHGREKFAGLDLFGVA